MNIITEGSRGRGRERQVGVHPFAALPMGLWTPIRGLEHFFFFVFLTLTLAVGFGVKISLVGLSVLIWSTRVLVSWFPAHIPP